MKVLLEIKEESRVPFFMELLESLDYIQVIDDEENNHKSQLALDLAEAFRDVKLHEEGKKELKLAKDLLNEF